ncbi:hypothetical protein N784_07220 [Pontibacillus litoralis JSM 072002]|uniref:Flagellar assembly protein FliH n=1 Tax=Pontibacillus litoralis JSM 072002 TaxID=1385512 RepID=A0A0A5G8S3_9BACI|nr:hypothetical protein N784_07220 [Pontibacillus litoralis JSM 072002]
MSNRARVIGLRPIHKQLDEQESEKVHNTYQEAEMALQHAKQKAAQLIKQANEQIEQNKAEWEKQKQAYQQEAYQDGYQQGFEFGKQEAESTFASLLEQGHQIVHLAEHDYAKRIEESEDTILALGIEASSKILHSILDAHPDQFLPIVKALVEEVKEQERIAIYVHPDQYGHLVKQKEELNMMIDHKQALSIYPKNNLDQHQCYVESPFGRVDASVDSQLTELRSKLFQLLEEAKGSEGS